MMKIFIAGPSAIHIARQTELCCRTLWQSFERSCSLDDFEASTIENAAAVCLSQTWTILQCAFVVATAFGREKQLLFQRVPGRGFRAIHEQQKST